MVRKRVQPTWFVNYLHLKVTHFLRRRVWCTTVVGLYSVLYDLLWHMWQ